MVPKIITTITIREARVVLVHVFEENREGAGVRQVGSISHVENILEEQDALEVMSVGKSGDPATAVLQAADDHDANLVCVAGRKRTPTGKVIFGSVTQEVILDSNYPVLVCDTQ
jgi:nucleotide-binding universal stress UspA family protein